MSAQKECLSALIFTDLEWTLSEFDITKKKADQLVCDFDTIQKMEFVTKTKRKIVQMKKSLSRIKISQQTGLPLIVVNYILNQAVKDNKKEIDIEQEENSTDSEDTLIFKSKQSQSIASTQELAPESQQLKKKTKIEPKEEPKKEQKKEQQKEVKQQVKQLNLNSKVKEKEKEKEKIGQTKEKQQTIISGKSNEQQKVEIKNKHQQDVKGGKDSTVLSKDKDKDKKIPKDLNKENRQKIPAANSSKENLIQPDKKIVSLTKSGIVVQNRNQKQYICYYCSKTFNEGMNLSKHFNTSHPNQDHLTLFCSLCKDLTFENFPSYFSHIKHHQKKRESMKYT